MARPRWYYAPTALFTTVAFLATLLPPRRALADEPAEAPAEAPKAPSEKAVLLAPEKPAALSNVAPHDEAKSVVAAPTVALPVAPPPSESLSAPVGGDKTGVSSQAISVPQGAGKVQGMGESFSAQMSTGIGTLTVPLAIPAARGAASPSIDISYSSGGGQGLVGMGWNFGVASIARQTDRGIPRYDDPPTAGGWHPNQDTFVFNGGQELVPICRIVSGSCEGNAVPAGEAFPAWAHTWQYFRPRIEGAYQRFFWSPDHRSWRIQSKQGEVLELGVPLDGSSATDALEADPQNAARVYRWNLARQYDAMVDSQGNPLNVVRYRYQTTDGRGYLTDIFDTPPVSGGASSSLYRYAHHTRLAYEARPDTATSYRSGWEVKSPLRLARVDITSKPFVAAGSAASAVDSPRELLRRYHFDYEAGSHVSLLSRVVLEGRCSSAIAEDMAGALGATNCQTLPPMTFGYGHVAPFKADGTPGERDLPGFEGFDERVHTMAQSPPHSLDEEMTDLFDVDSDGLPDVVVTDPARYGGKHGLFLNTGGQFGAPSTIATQGVLGANANVLTLRNTNLAPLDLDGDGTIDLLHMPQVKRYSTYRPEKLGAQWTWVGREVETAGAQSPKIDFTRGAPDTRVMDVNGDGLVDVVYSAGTQYQTFFSLGRYPGGDGQFGHASLTSATAAAISQEPVTSCIPWSATGIRLSDSDVKVADMNGDGLPDLVRIRPGDVRYWPGRGNGYWGTGDPSTCPAGGFGQDRHVAMTTSPFFNDSHVEGLRLDDVNGDGLDDVVIVRFNAIDIWLNVNGTGWTASRHVVENAPVSPAIGKRVRLVDVNGSGTRDIVYGDGGNYRYIDLLGGSRPWVLTQVANGLGKTTELEYTSSTAMMLEAEASGRPWEKKAPVTAHVVRRIVERDNLALVGRPAGIYVTENTFRDAVYDGQQREFRGFRSGSARRIGDDNSPTATTESQFLLGECVSDCGPESRWKDNPREVLKGSVIVSEMRDESGVYLGTEHHEYEVRKLYAGMDGRGVYDANATKTDAWSYDTASFVASPEAVSLVDVTGETPKTITLRSRAGRTHTQSVASADLFGNQLRATARGCVDGCAEVDEEISSIQVPGRRPDDASGWAWRTVDSYVQGADGQRRKWTTAVYNQFGNLETSIGHLAGTLPLDRFHEVAGSDIAPAPPLASTDGDTWMGRAHYDAFGNATRQVSPNKRCRDVVYDADYAQLTVGETVYVGNAGAECGETALRGTAGYDRGLGVVTVAQGLYGELTTVDYDGFGRVTSMHKPSAASGLPSALPSVRMEYFLPSDAAATPFVWVHTQTHDGALENSDSYREAWSLADGMGRTIVTFEEADPSAGDAGQWVVTGLTEYDNKGTVRRAYMPWFWTGVPRSYPIAEAPDARYSRQRYDAFGRAVQSYGLDGAVLVQTRYHALSVDKWDAADLAAGPHQGTFATERRDGHGRPVERTDRVHVGAQLEERRTRTRLSPTGDPVVMTRERGADRLVRWARYDTFGRMVLNVEPSATRDFNPDPTTSAAALKTWRYAYNDNGDLIGSSDARGCGQNFHYDAGGRVVAEDYSPCQSNHAPYSAPNLATGEGTEVFYRYDAYSTEESSIAGFPIDARLTLGRVVSVSDKGQTAVTRFDGRGRVTGLARRIAKPGATNANLGDRYAPRWYMQSVTYDAADRPVDATTGAVVSELLGADQQSFVKTEYTKRSTTRRIAGSYGELVSAIVHDADGAVTKIQYGDAAKTNTELNYDLKRRLSSVQTYRGKPALWASSTARYAAPDSATTQALLEDADFKYDLVDNPIEIRDYRLAHEWPAGAKPVNRKMQYDDLYRLKRVDYQYPDGDDKWESPFKAENEGRGGATKPSPHIAFDKRVLWQTYDYDWLGNTTRTGDDARGFYDRSLGAIVNRGYQLMQASGDASARAGGLNAAYDVAGYMTELSVGRSGPCLPVGASCVQRYEYEWDEVGRLAGARRFDGEVEGPSVAAVELKYVYDGADNRVLKTAIDAQRRESHTAYIFGSLELRRAEWDGTDYARNRDTERVYLHAHGVRLARIAYLKDDTASLVSGNRHVLLDLPDHLGSSSIVIDHATGELVERSTYLPTGGAESDYRPERWESSREDYRFTGKEEDIEVGLLYFGKRYLSPQLGRWISADPLTIHGLGADPNCYAYVSGAVFRAVDPTGLDGAPAGGHQFTAAERAQLSRVPSTRGRTVHAFNPRGTNAEGQPAFSSAHVGGKPAASRPAPTPPKPAPAPQGTGTAQVTPGASGGSPGGAAGGNPTGTADHAQEGRLNGTDDHTFHGEGAQKVRGSTGTGFMSKDGGGSATKQDLAVVMAATVADPTSPVQFSANGKSGGVPDGACDSCSGSDFGQVLHIVKSAVGAISNILGVGAAVEQVEKAGAKSVADAPRGAVLKRDLTKGAHAPDTPMGEVIDRAYSGQTPNGYQGRWTSKDAAERAAGQAGTSVGAVPIQVGDGVIVTPLPDRGGVWIRNADHAVTIPKKAGSRDVIHTYPIGPENPAHPRYGK